MKLLLSLRQSRREWLSFEIAAIAWNDLSSKEAQSLLLHTQQKRSSDSRATCSTSAYLLFQKYLLEWLSVLLPALSFLGAELFLLQLSMRSRMSVKVLHCKALRFLLIVGHKWRICTEVWEELYETLQVCVAFAFSTVRGISMWGGGFISVSLYCLT